MVTIKHLWSDLLREEYLHIDTLKFLLEEHPMFIQMFTEWLGVDRKTLRQFAANNMLPCAWLEDYLLRGSYDTAGFKVVSDVFTKLMQLNERLTKEN